MAGNLTTAGATIAAAALDGAYWIGLGTGQSSSGLLGEPSTGGYARATVTVTASGVSISNGSSVTIPATTISFPGLTHAGLFTASSGGDCIWVGPLASAVTLASLGVTISAGDIDLIFDTAA